MRKRELLEQYQDKIALVDWAEYTTILEPHNDYEQALNLYYTFEYAKIESFKIDDATEVKSKFRIMLNPGDDDAPESSQCKKKCGFFVNRISALYRREKQWTFGSANSELKQHCETSAQGALETIKALAQRCQNHLEKVLNEGQ